MRVLNVNIHGVGEKLIKCASFELRKNGTTGQEYVTALNEDGEVVGEWLRQLVYGCHWQELEVKPTAVGSTAAKVD